MRTVIALVFVALSTGSALAQDCGVQPITPITPIGCNGIMQPICTCDANGRCFWQFICVRR